MTTPAYHGEITIEGKKKNLKLKTRVKQRTEGVLIKNLK